MIHFVELLTSIFQIVVGWLVISLIFLVFGALDFYSFTHRTVLIYTVFRLQISFAILHQ
jgi:hypothetical protein